jgi:hypothetical protein
MIRTIVHIILGLLLWVVFCFYWHIVMQQPITEQTRRALIIVGTAVAVITIFDWFWIFHNLRIAKHSRRRGRRAEPPAPLATPRPAASPNATAPRAPSTAPASPVVGANRNGRLSERARQDREIVYFLQQPETHSFDLYHDYTESRPGINRYLNIVRGGSTVANPSSMLLDTGEQLRVETLKGSAISTAGIDIGEPVTGESEVVVIHFTPVKQGQSVRLRIRETYTDPNRYVVSGDELIWDRAFGRPANAMMLPTGWYLTNSSIPATVRLHTDGRVVLDFQNPRNDNVEVLVTAKRRR